MKIKKIPLKLPSRRTLHKAVIIAAAIFAISVICFAIHMKPVYREAKERVYGILADMDTGTFRRQSNTKIYDKDGVLIGKLGYERYEYKNIADISDYIQQGYIDVEDHNFKSHNGVDFKAILRAGLNYIKNRGHVTQGGSTITQQVIKNNLLSSERTFSRKALEIMIAFQLEKEFTKADIMEFYCNSNYYGNSCYGVEAAAQYYFGVDANSVTLAEAAMIVGTSNLPNKYNPVADYELCMQKKERVLRQMLERGSITEDEFETAVAERPEIVRKTDEVESESYPVSYAIYCSAIRLMEKQGFSFRYSFDSEDDYQNYKDVYGEAYQQAITDIRDGGYKISTSYDMDVQQDLQDSINHVLAQETDIQEDGRFDMQAAAICIDNVTGQVIAAVGGRGDNDSYNRAYLARRQPGSSIKPLLVYGPAIEEGVIEPASVYDDSPVDINGYNPGNADGEYRGEMTVREALARSVNTISAQVYRDTGTQNALSYLEKLRFSTLSFGDAYNMALALGGLTNGVTVSDMSRAYAAIANGGEMRDSTCINKLESETDGVIYDIESAKPVRVYSKDTAFILEDMMQGAFNEEYGTAHEFFDEEHVYAGKTGTTNANRDAWFAGFSSSYTTVVWTGCDMPKSNDNLTGGGYPLHIWNSFMKKMLERGNTEKFEMPSSMLLKNAEGEQKAADITKNGYWDRPEGWDYASSIAQNRFIENERKKRIEAEKKDAEEVVRNFEEFQINSTEDVSKLDGEYQYALSVVGKIEDDNEASPFKERVESKYAMLSGEVAETWQAVIAEQEAVAQAETDAANASAAAESKENALYSLHDTRVNAVWVYINALNARTLYTDEVESLISLGSSALEACSGYSEYDSLASEFNSAVTEARSQPNVEQVESEARQAEEARLEAERRAEEIARNEEIARQEAEERGTESAEQNSTESDTFLF